MSTLAEIVRYSDDYLGAAGIADWHNALNGLQIENSGTVTRIGASVDVSSAILETAAGRGINLLIVHHGFFWQGLQPVSGSLHRQLKLALENDIALYSSHLPLDLHEEVGNNVLLARALKLEATEPFLRTKGSPIGRKAIAALSRAELIKRLEQTLQGPVKCLGSGPAETKVIGIVTGAAGSEIYEVAREGIDTLITGEGPHWSAVAAEELGMNLLLGGHYATETFGVKALAGHLSARFGIPWEFIDHPTGL